MKEHICPKCKGVMEKGFIGDKETFGHQTRQNWGTGINNLGTGMDNALPVISFRCVKCGFLESYTD